MSTEQEARQQPTASRHYANDAIEVTWEAKYCIHAAMCWRSLPGVFQPRSIPWVRLEGAAAADVARVVMTCPSGALSYRRLDGGPQEQPPATTTVEATTDGPLYVRGPLTITDADGHVVREATRVALCRCGHSGNKPFCDMSHARVGFKG